MLEYKKDYKAWLYLAIPLILLSIFTFFPLVKTILISLFSQFDNVHNTYGAFFDFEAYKAVLRDKIFLDALLNTLIIVFISVPASTVLALLIAVALNSIKDRKSTRLNSSHVAISYAVFCLKKKITN